jgi:hypothetical protein
VNKWGADNEQLQQDTAAMEISEIGATTDVVNTF